MWVVGWVPYFLSEPQDIGHAQPGWRCRCQTHEKPHRVVALSAFRLPSHPALGLAQHSFFHPPMQINACIKILQPFINQDEMMDFNGPKRIAVMSNFSCCSLPQGGCALGSQELMLREMMLRFSAGHPGTYHSPDLAGPDSLLPALCKPSWLAVVLHDPVGSISSLLCFVC